MKIRFSPHPRALSLIATISALAVLPACTTISDLKANRQKQIEQKARVVEREKAAAAAETWRQSTPGWKSKTYRDTARLALATPKNCRVEISLDRQRGALLVDEAIAMEFAVASGRRSHPTPPGTYKILAKEKTYASNLYGKIVDTEGTVVISDADTRKHVPEEGTSFVGASMPYWMRLTDTGVGMHVGYVPGGRPASHGCIRLKREVAVQLFGMLPVGTPVLVVESAPAFCTPTPAKAKKP